jgi:hypothetical protein
MAMLPNHTSHVHVDARDRTRTRDPVLAQLAERITTARKRGADLVL